MLVPFILVSFVACIISSLPSLENNKFVAKEQMVHGNSAKCKKTVNLGSFNIQKYGKTKSENEHVMHILYKIIQHFDIIAIQEVKEGKSNAVQKLYQLLSTKNKCDFSYIVSQLSGSSSAKSEKYLIIYRNDSFKVEHASLYEDTSNSFSRPPFVVVFSTKFQSSMSKFAIGVVHTSPKTAVSEVRMLEKVVDWCMKKYKIENIAMIGDYNFDCSYASCKMKKTVTFYTDKEKYLWAIPDGVDTTVGNSYCAYDRMVMTGQGLKSSYIQHSGSVYKFDEKFGLDRKQALAISDHYPVQIKLCFQ